MTAEPLRITRKAKHDKPPWIPACAGMTTYADRKRSPFQTVYTFQTAYKVIRGRIKKQFGLKYKP
jgi:hypothetical protein